MKVTTNYNYASNQNITMKGPLSNLGKAVEKRSLRQEILDKNITELRNMDVFQTGRSIYGSPVFDTTKLIRAAINVDPKTNEPNLSKHDLQEFLKVRAFMKKGYEQSFVTLKNVADFFAAKGSLIK